MPPDLGAGQHHGVNSASASVNVGIGTTTPQYTLGVNGNANFDKTWTIVLTANWKSQDKSRAHSIK